MSDSLEPGSPGTLCDRALDHAYGELSGEEATAFERHLAGCARCQAELAVLARVRGAVKEALPQVEPPSAASGASPFHAQLLHAAAQRRPSRGKLLTLARRAVAHPGYAAAAGLLLVGGALGMQLYRGQLVLSPPVEMKMAKPAPAAASSTVAKQLEEREGATAPAVPAEQPRAPVAPAKASNAKLSKEEYRGGSASEPDVLMKPAPLARHAATKKDAEGALDGLIGGNGPAFDAKVQGIRAPSAASAGRSSLAKGDDAAADGLRQKAIELATSGRCDEADKLRLTAERAQARFSSNEALEFTRCRQAQAQAQATGGGGFASRGKAKKVAPARAVRPAQEAAPADAARAAPAGPPAATQKAYLR